MRTRTRYLPIEAALEGMMLAESVKDRYQRVLLPIGVALTLENIQQLTAHQAEFVCVSITDTRTPEQISVDTATTAHRMLAIFESSDLTQPVMAALFNQVLLYRSA
jgi:ABC-type uncharacterized transport system involved in gliding motility auxiliary subunit